MKDKTKAFAAKRLVGDETFSDAVKTMLDHLNAQLLAATTPEERERKFQEWHGLKRVSETLKILAKEADK